MKIGYDAKRAFCNLTGLGNYSRTLIESMFQQYPSNQYYLYTSKEKTKFINEQNNLFIRRPSNTVLQILHPMWRTFFINSQIHSDKIDLYHGLSNELPLSLKSCKTIVTIHDLIYLTYPMDFNFLDRQVYHQKVQYACQNSDLILAISNQTKKDLIEKLRIPEQKIVVLYQSIDPEFYQLKNQDELNNFKESILLPEKYILYVGSLVGRKRPDQLIKAFNLTKDQHDHCLIILGNGPLKSKINSMIKENDLIDRVRLLEGLNKYQTSCLYQGAQLFAFPSIYEGFGIPILEAMASQTAVLTSDQSCLPEIAGPASFYIDPDDTSSFGKKMADLVNAPHLLSSSVEKSKDWLSQFSPGPLTEKLNRIYHQLPY